MVRVRATAFERVAPTMSQSEFSKKWGPGGIADGLNERAGAQLHFIDLCALLGVPPPADPENYCFERGLWGISGGRRFADVWMRGRFGWEYKAPGGDLKKALEQLMRYALPLENPPLLIVSDRHSIQIHTHFTGHPSERIDLSHAELRDPRKQALLRAAFMSPNDFRPNKTTEQVTQDLAGSFAQIADALRERGEAPLTAAHFLTQCIFCCFAESVEVLPGNVFQRVVQKRQTPENLGRSLTLLFRTMNKGGDFGADTIPWFNGGLFNHVEVPILTPPEIEQLAAVAGMSWSSIDPSILGTLFERGLDPSRRHQLGAHYTDAATIERLVTPVVREPLLAEWDRIKRSISGLLSQRDILSVRAKGIPSASSTLKARYGGIRSQAHRANRHAKDLQSGFMERLHSFRVLDPACGSGNFLFLALKALKDIEHQVNQDSEELGLERQLPVTGPHNVLGIEINEYAAELARATIWIGELQWRKEHGYGWKENPILDPLDQIECRDALIDSQGHEAPWPRADVVVGNPPFVGDKKMRGELGRAYTERLRSCYRGRLPGGADLVCFWFEKARSQIESGGLTRAGLVATNSIRGGANREVLNKIVSQLKIFSACSDEPWVNEGASVRVSLVAFGDTPIQDVRLDGRDVTAIAADLTDPGASGDVDVTRAKSLGSNCGACFQGTSKVGSFDVSEEIAEEWLALPNVNGCSNTLVVKPWVNGQDLTRRPSRKWIIDFGDLPESRACEFEAPFAHVLKYVFPERQNNNRLSYARYWWRHAESRSGMRRALAACSRYVASPRVSKHRVFVWVDAPTVPDTAVVVVCRSDDISFGLLHSRFHELWSLRMCTWMGKGNDPRYTPTSCFETFPFPSGLAPANTGHQDVERLTSGEILPAGLPPSVHSHAIAIAKAASALDRLRSNWLNPPEWTIRMKGIVPLGMRHSPFQDRNVAKPQFHRELDKRTLTNLYNQRPSWLTKAHEELDAAVAAAYGWIDYSPTLPDEEVLRRLLALNLQQAHQQRGEQRELPLLGMVKGEALSNEGSVPKVKQRRSRKAA